VAVGTSTSHLLDTSSRTTHDTFLYGYTSPICLAAEQASRITASLSLSLSLSLGCTWRTPAACTRLRTILTQANQSASPPRRRARDTACLPILARFTSVAIAPREPGSVALPSRSCYTTRSEALLGKTNGPGGLHPRRNNKRGTCQRRCSRQDGWPRGEQLGWKHGSHAK